MKIALALIMACVSEAALSWSSCGGADDVMTLDGITFTPANPRKGDKLTVSVKGQLKSTVDAGAKVSTKVKWGFIKVPVKDVDVCAALAPLPDVPHCPLQQGPVDVTQSVSLPKDMPPGKYDVNLNIVDQFSKRVVCLNVKLSV